MGSKEGQRQSRRLGLDIKKDWYVKATLATKHCSQLSEFLIVKCQQFYLPRDVTNVIVAAFYIPLSASTKTNTNKALGERMPSVSL